MNKFKVVLCLLVMLSCTGCGASVRQVTVTNGLTTSAQVEAALGKPNKVEYSINGDPETYWLVYNRFVGLITWCLDGRCVTTEYGGSSVVIQFKKGLALVHEYLVPKYLHQSN